MKGTFVPVPPLGGKQANEPDGAVVNSLIYIVGLVVVIIAVLWFFGIT